MNATVVLDVRRKLAVLADAAKYDASCSSSGARRQATPGGLGNSEGQGICHSYTPDGRCVSLLKILFTNYCIYDCQYCVNRISSDVERAQFTPGEVVALTLALYARNVIEGLFLSSGIIKSPDATMELLIAVARSLREDHGFGGYIHLKTTPGASPELLARAGAYADRLSVNVELPTAQDLAALAPDKAMPAIESVMGAVRQRIEEDEAEPKGRSRAFAPAGQTTQMIVGATATPDRAILDTASRLYRAHRLRRVYYSAFSPIPHADARLRPEAPPLQREHRLYQADWLVRFYGFSVDELAFEAGALRLDVDPKLAWALAHRDFFPVDLNLADRDVLLRVPGLGLRVVNRLLQHRRERAVRLDDLRRLRVPVGRVAPFVITADARRPATALLDAVDLAARFERPAQLELFASNASALTGQL